MKCTACGLPLSPAKTSANCPRCGTPVGAAAKTMAGSDAWNGSAATPGSVGAFPQDGQWGQARQFPQAFQPQVVLPPQPGQVWGAGANGMQGPGTFSPVSPAPRRPPRSPRFGFLIAGICVCAGGLLLVLVYFLAMSQSSNNSITSGNPPIRATATSTAAVTASPAGSPSPAATTYPGQQYITSAQMSSGPQPAAPVSTFKVHATIYVVFTIHSGGQAGAICLKWYLNGQHSFDYAFPVGAHTTASYGEAMFDLPGSGYVELYWASSKACTDETLAQHVNFTITT